MKLNNRGFAISTIMYMVLIMAITLVTLTLSLLSNRNIILEKIKDETMDNVYKLPEESRLPFQYQEVEYIESTGTQYIDTGIIPDQNSGFDVVYLTKDSTSNIINSWGSIFGSRYASLEREFQLTTYSSNSSYLGTLRFETSSYNAGITVNKKMHSTLISQVYTNNDDVSFTIGGTFTSPQTLTVFALNNNGEIIQHGSLQLYSFKLYNGETVVRDFIPCYRKLDGVIGLFDIIENKFYINSGSGTFKRGGNV